jgi:hypothetical protein
LTEGVFVTHLYGNAGNLSLTDCVGYDKLPLHERYILGLVLLPYGNITGKKRFKIINTSLRVSKGKYTTAMPTKF